MLGRVANLAAGQVLYGKAQRWGQLKSLTLDNQNLVWERCRSADAVL